MAKLWHRLGKLLGILGKMGQSTPESGTNRTKRGTIIHSSAGIQRDSMGFLGTGHDMSGAVMYMKYPGIP